MITLSAASAAVLKPASSSFASAFSTTSTQPSLRERPMATTAARRSSGWALASSSPSTLFTSAPGASQPRPTIALSRASGSFSLATNLSRALRALSSFAPALPSARIRSLRHARFFSLPIAAVIARTDSGTASCSSATIASLRSFSSSLSRYSLTSFQYTAGESTPIACIRMSRGSGASSPPPAPAGAPGMPRNQPRRPMSSFLSSEPMYSIASGSGDISTRWIFSMRPSPHSEPLSSLISSSTCSRVGGARFAPGTPAGSNTPPVTSRRGGRPLAGTAFAATGSMALMAFEKHHCSSSAEIS